MLIRVGSLAGRLLMGEGVVCAVMLLQFSMLPYSLALVFKLTYFIILGCVGSFSSAQL